MRLLTFLYGMKFIRNVWAAAFAPIFVLLVTVLTLSMKWIMKQGVWRHPEVKGYVVGIPVCFPYSPCMHLDTIRDRLLKKECGRGLCTNSIIVLKILKKYSV